MTCSYMKKGKKKFEKKINMTDSKKNNIFQDHQFSIFFLNRTDWFEGPKNTIKCIFCLFSDFLCAIEMTFLLAVLKWIEINYEVEHSFFSRRYFFNFGIHYYVCSGKKQILMKYVKEYSIWIDWAQTCVRDLIRRYIIHINCITTLIKCSCT